MKFFQLRIVTVLAFAFAIGFTSCTDDDTDACLDLNCGDFGTCVTDENTGLAFCNCDAGYSQDASGECVADDPCAAVTCQENATCELDVDGNAVCACDEGYVMDADTGECMVVNATEKFVGTWKGVEDCIAEDVVLGECESDNNYEYSIEIADNGDGTIGITNFFEVFPPGETVNATASGDVFTLESDMFTWLLDGFQYDYEVVSGTATYAVDGDGNETMQFDYVVRDLDPAYSQVCVANCSALWEKQ